MYHVKCKLPVFVRGALFKLCLNIHETERSHGSKHKTINYGVWTSKLGKK